MASQNASVLIPACGCYQIWQRLCRCDQVKNFEIILELCWMIESEPNTVTCVLIEGGIRRSSRDREMMWPWRWRLEWFVCNPRKATTTKFQPPQEARMRGFLSGSGAAQPCWLLDLCPSAADFRLLDRIHAYGMPALQPEAEPSTPQHQPQFFIRFENWN